MAKKYQQRERGKSLDSPLYAVEVLPNGELDHSAAYDPDYCERCETCGVVYAKALEHDCEEKQET